MILEDAGYEVRTASEGREGLQRALKESPDLILCDVKMPGLDGLSFVQEYRRAGGTGLVIMMTAYGSTELAVEAMKKGAYDYLAKPFESDEVILRLKLAEEREHLRREVERLRKKVRPEDRFPDIVFESAAMMAAVELATRVARHPSTVLITGESGTGKEVIARHVHAESPRADGPFVPVNCGAIPENLLESELFGHVKGAYTGATTDRPGLFEEANGGTLFLDEIGELPQPLQVKLLRALQEGEIRRVGESAARKVDVRILCATARDLQKEVQEGRFRSDLFYRINVVYIHIPPLRHRREDIPRLVEHFIDKYRRQLGVAIKGVEPDAMRALENYPWPGNVRELENVIERGIVLAEGPRIRLADLPDAVVNPAQVADQPVVALSEDNLSVKKHTAELEKRLIARALEITGGNKTRAAELLELSYRALLYKIRDYGLEPHSAG
ncbi:MAG: sigma-54-dependent Fis family transcriptional regulator [Gemmatimonadetes bacterium]|nr:sigma-54-dependent Fis family transcriptional regulator [Gemmatimonadota bacterium]